jgi:hypothetical protein
MTNPISLVLAALIALVILADVMANQSAGSLFMGRKLLDLIEYVAIWR